jgi:hypothetical protein
MESLFNDCEEPDIEVETRLSFYIFMTRSQSTAKNHNIRTANECFENILQMSGNYCNKKKYIHEGIKMIFNSWAACYRYSKNMCFTVAYKTKQTPWS